MKSRIIFALAALALALTACAAETSDPVEPTDSAEVVDVASATATPAEAGVLGEPGTATEYIYWRCIPNGGLYVTKSLCLQGCTGGTCRVTVICKDGSGQQIPCP